MMLRGDFLIGSRIRNDQGVEQDVRLGWLTIRPAEEDPSAPPGQWTLRIISETKSNVVSLFFIRVASRLGILPVRLASNFAAALANNKPITVDSLNMEKLPDLTKEANAVNVYGNHAYAVKSVDAVGRTVNLQNPWGSNHVADLSIKDT